MAKRVGRRTVRTGLDLGLLVGDDAATIALGPRARGGDHDAQRQRAHGDGLEALEVLGPELVLGKRVNGSQCHHLAAVHDRAAAHGQDVVHTLCPRQLGPLHHLGERGVGHDSAELHQLGAGGRHLGRHLVKDSRTLGGGPAECDHDLHGPSSHELGGHVGDAVSAEVEARRVLKYEVVHEVVPSVVP